MVDDPLQNGNLIQTNPEPIEEAVPVGASLKIGVKAGTRAAVRSHA
jgi:hypothetical protein